MSAEPSGIGLLTVFEELFWGDAGIALSILATGLAAAALASSGTPSSSASGCRRCSALPAIPTSPRSVPQAGAGSDVGTVRTRARYDQAADEWVLDGTKTWATNGGIANVHIVVASVHPELGTRGQATFIVPPNTPGLSQGQKFRSTASAPHTPPRWCWTSAAASNLILGGMDRFEHRIARARARTRARPRCRPSSAPARSWGDGPRRRAGRL